MKFAYYTVAFFLVAISNIKSMDKCSFNEFSEEFAFRIVYDVAGSDYYFESCIATLRSCTLVSKLWHKVMTDYANLIIDRLANKLCVRCDTKIMLYSSRIVKGLNGHKLMDTLEKVHTSRCRKHDPALTKKIFPDEHDHHEVAKVAVAVWLCTQGSRNWLEDNYPDEKSYKTLFGKIVQYPYALDFIPRLRKLNGTCNNTAIQEIDTLVGILKHLKVPDQVGKFLLNRLCGQENASQKEGIDSILTEVLCGQSGDNFKQFLIKLVIRENPECVHEKAPGSAHQFWCDVIKSGKALIMEEVFKISGFKMCERCKLSPRRKALEERKSNRVSYLLPD